MEAWVGRETAAFRLPPSRLALDPADAIRLAHDGRLVDLRLVSIADAEARGIEAVRQDRATYDLPPGDPRAASLTRAVVFGAPDAVLMDLPQLTEDQPAHRPFAAAHAVPWPGEIAVFRSPSMDGFELLTTAQSRARIGMLVSDFYAGPASRFDLGNVLVVDLLTGTLESVPDLTLFSGANALAIESAPDVWEIVQAGAAELIAPGRYRLTRLLRGQRGTEGVMGNPAPAGARVVVLDDSLASLPIAEADLGIPWNWRIGPASRLVSDETYVAQAFTPAGVGLRPFSVAHVEQPWRKARSPGDLTIRWTRRSRALAADSWGGLEVPLAEELEAYEVEILDGPAVKRVLSTATTSAVYTAAQQTADWGAPLGPGDTLDIRIFQLSALVGRGAPKTVTLELDAEIAALIAEDQEETRKLEIIRSIPGIGMVTASAILAFLPEIGQLERKQVASLAGLAPFTRSSGTWVGKSFIKGGRTQLRQALYMPALIASRFNPDLKAKYTALRAAGKPAKVALVALMRKLIELANALVKSDRKWAPKAC
jgi:hypothetical protein